MRPGSLSLGRRTQDQLGSGAHQAVGAMDAVDEFDEWPGFRAFGVDPAQLDAAEVEQLAFGVQDFGPETRIRLLEGRGELGNHDR